MNLKPNRRWLRICTNLAAAQMCSDNPVPVQMWQGVPSPGAAATSTYRTARLGAVPVSLVSLVQCYEYMGQLRRRHCLAAAPLSAAKGSAPPRLPTADDRSQGYTRPHTSSTAHPDCRGLWLVKRQAAPDQQLRVEGHGPRARSLLAAGPHRCRAVSVYCRVHASLRAACSR